jgi:pilus assembly protein CpaF
MADGSRYLSSLTLVEESDTGGVTLRECVSFDETTRSWTLVEEPAFVKQGVREGILNEGEVEQWRKSCA